MSSQRYPLYALFHATTYILLHTGHERASSGSPPPRCLPTRCNIRKGLLALAASAMLPQPPRSSAMGCEHPEAAATTASVILLYSSHSSRST